MMWKINSNWHLCILMFFNCGVIETVVYECELVQKKLKKKEYRKTYDDHLKWFCDKKVVIKNKLEEKDIMN